MNGFGDVACKKEKKKKVTWSSILF